jgi:hypothetical protein
VAEKQCGTTISENVVEVWFDLFVRGKFDRLFD